jgi:hypothetical protein
MAKETLYVPESHLADVIKVIRLGLEAAVVISKAETKLVDKRMKEQFVIHPEVDKKLRKWCNDEEDYLKRMEGDG